MSNNAPLTPSQQGHSADLDPQRLKHLEEAEKKHEATIRQLTAERDQLRTDLENLRVEQEKTAKILAEVTEERNTYHHELLYLLREGLIMTDTDIDEAIKIAVPADDLLRELGLELGLDEKD